MGLARAETGKRTEIVNDFLASIHILSAALDEVLERELKENLSEKVTLSQFKILALVARKQGGSISNVAEFLDISLPAASKAVDKLVRRKLIRRLERSDDRRAASLELTIVGQILLKRYHRVEDSALGKLFQEVKPEEFEEATVLMDRLAASLIDPELAAREICYRCGIYFRHTCQQRSIRKCSCDPHPFIAGDRTEPDVSGLAEEE